MAEGGGPAWGDGQQPPPQVIQQQQLPMNWSHFKPEFSGKPDEDVEAHLLRTNDWMTTHDFPEAVKVQRFCLTLVGEARNWYATLEPVAMTWPELQTMFRCRYSKIGNTREQLFHAWRSFHYNENVETHDAYVIRIKQVATLLGYEDLQVLEVFKNTVPNRLYWVLFSIDNLHDAVETAKRFLTKEKIDRQMTGQSSTPFIKLTDKKRKSVTFNAKDALEKTSENMERMTALMNKMYIKLEQKDMPYKPQIYQRGRGQNWRQFSRGNHWRGYRPYSRNCNEGNRGYGRGRGNFQRGNFHGRGNFRGRYNKNRMDRYWEIGEHGDNPGQEKEIEIDEVSHCLVLDQDQDRGLVQIEIGLDVSNVGSMTTLPINVLIWFLIIQIGKVIVQGQYHCIWQIVIQDQIRSNI